MSRKTEGHSQNHNMSTKMMVLTALLFAVAIILSIVENQLPPIITFVPGIKFGLSNIVVMFSLFCLSKKHALLLVLLKSMFALLTRGAAAGMLSFCGGVFSILIMLLVIALFKDKISYMLVSICGAVMHNITQFVTISLLFTNIFFWAYLPILVMAGIIAGVVTAVLLRILLPALNRL